LKLYGQNELQQLSKFIIDLKRNKLSRTRKTSRKPASKQRESPALVFHKKTRGLSRIKESLSWQYRFSEAPSLPAKSSVTELTHRSDEYVKFDYSTALQRQPTAVAMAEADLAESPEARLIGTATHLVISQLDLTKPVTKEAVGKTLEGLLADGALSAAVAQYVNTESILAFFQSDLGRLALDPKNTIWREWPFTFALPATFVAHTSLLDTQVTSHQSPITDDEVVIIQGIIDLLIKKPDGLLIIDFKTDRITAEEVSERAELYRRQLELYSRAASAILKDRLLAKWLYFLTPGCAIEVE